MINTGVYSSRPLDRLFANLGNFWDFLLGGLTGGIRRGFIKLAEIDGPDHPLHGDYFPNSQTAQSGVLEMASGRPEFSRGVFQPDRDCLLSYNQDSSIPLPAGYNLAAVRASLFPGDPDPLNWPRTRSGFPDYGAWEHTPEGLARVFSEED